MLSQEYTINSAAAQRMDLPAVVGIEVNSKAPILPVYTTNTSWDQTGTTLNIKDDDCTVTQHFYSEEALCEPLSISATESQLQRLGKEQPIQFALTALDIAQKSVLGENNLLQTPQGRKRIADTFTKWHPEQSGAQYCAPAVDDHTAHAIRNALTTMAQSTDEKGRNGLQHELHQLASVGHNVRPIIDHIGTSFVKLFDQNPGRALRYIHALGLHQLFPQLEEKLQIRVGKNYQKEETPEEFYARAFGYLFKELNGYNYETYKYEYFNRNHQDYSSDDKMRDIQAARDLDKSLFQLNTPSDAIDFVTPHPLWQQEQRYDAALSVMSNHALVQKNKNNERYTFAAFKRGQQRISRILDHWTNPELSQGWIASCFEEIGMVFPKIWHGAAHEYDNDRYPDVPPPDPQLIWNPRITPYMERCIEASQTAGIRYGENPFVAMMVKFSNTEGVPDKVRPLFYNNVSRSGKLSEHAEANAMHDLRKYIVDEDLKEWVLICNMEPCKGLCTDIALEFQIGGIVYAVFSEQGGFSNSSHEDLIKQMKLVVPGKKENTATLPFVIGGVLLQQAIPVFQHSPDFNASIQSSQDTYERRIIDPLKALLDQPYDDYIWKPKPHAPKNHL
jgi:tRNA(Arg) A34 adenosine deaminase TadA